jgi:hypothetical protein
LNKILIIFAWIDMLVLTSLQPFHYVVKGGSGFWLLLRYNLSQKCLAPPFLKVDFGSTFSKVDFGSTFSKGGIT